MRTMMLAALAMSLGLPTVSKALDPDEAGKITAEIEEKNAAVRKEFGDRSYKELTREERKSYDAKMRAGHDEVLEKHGTSSRDYEKGMLKLGREGLKQEQATQKAWAEKRAEDAKKAAEKKKVEDVGGIKVQKGFDEKNPPNNITEQNGIQVQKGGGGKGGEGIEIPVPGADKAAPAADKGGKAAPTAPPGK